MERSKVEHMLSGAVVDAASPASDLALDAIVAGLPVEETTPAPAGDVDVVWPATDIQL